MKKLLLLMMLSLATVAMSAQDYRLWYDRPATHWLEALPIGNSQLGAMVYGGTDVEEIQLNEETFWSGSPHDNNSPEAKAHLQEVRRLVFEGREKEAQGLIDKYFIKGPHGMRFLPMGSLRLSMDYGTEAKAEDYRRELNLGNALNPTRSRVDGVTYQRTVFASQADPVIIVRMQADKAGALTFNMSYDSQLETMRTVGLHQLSAIVNGVEHEGVPQGLSAECRVKVVADGEIVEGEESLSVVKATTATLYIVAATNYVNYHDVSADPLWKNALKRGALKDKTYEQLLDRHVRKYQAQYDRVSLTLPKSENSSLPTDRRLEAFAGGNDLDMVALLMQYGRYLLISSSQPGGQPANLQGVWNDKMNAPWDSKYTININAEMNYWPSLV
ncbi:MAG: glycoside hydrolase family 95 protein, partial [Bacteroidaceae bacterium]|nr:glycoside hydrolase family 95 protein [Bacteroidaceae bacterium]